MLINMIWDYFIVAVVVAVLSVVQSVFGMGILVFGTPTLLLLGYDFTTSLSFLLPASWSIAFLQTFNFKSSRPNIPVSLYVLCLPCIGVGLLLSDSVLLISWLTNIIGATLIMSALIRYWEPAQCYFSAMLNRNMAAYHVIMGLVHGITNLGGALLAVFASEIHTDKDKVRYVVAYYYCAFNSIQILVLAIIIEHIELMIAHAFTAIVSSAIYIFFGNRLFNAVSNKLFTNVLTLFMVFYGVVIFIQK